MPPQEEHERIEDMVESPHLAEHAARSLEEAADSGATLEGYESINNARFPEELEREAREDQPKDREKGHPVP